MKRLKTKPNLSYANVVATLALIAAVAGGTTALAGVAKAPKNSVVTKSIRQGNVTARDLAGLNSFRAATTITDTGSNDGIPTSGTAVARCPKGARAISGGGSAGGNRVALQTSSPNGNNGWTVAAISDNGSTTQVLAVVYCLPDRPASPYTIP
jgi:hypothetical protein